MPNTSDLVKKKTDYNAEIKDIKNKHFTTTDYNKILTNMLHAKITAKGLVNESGLNEEIKTFATEEEIKKLAAKVELKKIVKPQTY